MPVPPGLKQQKTKKTYETPFESIDKSVRLDWNMAAVIATIFSSRLVSATV